jgi:hypothetical protein
MFLRKLSALLKKKRGFGCSICTNPRATTWDRSFRLVAVTKSPPSSNSARFPLKTILGKAGEPFTTGQTSSLVRPELYRPQHAKSDRFRTLGLRHAFGSDDQRQPSGDRCGKGDEHHKRSIGIYNRIHRAYRRGSGVAVHCGTPSNPSIAKGLTQQFRGTGTFSNGSTQNLTASVT